MGKKDILRVFIKIEWKAKERHCLKAKIKRDRTVNFLKKKLKFSFWAPKMAPRRGSKSEFHKILLSSSSLTPKQLTNQKWGWSMKNCDLYCEKTEIFILGTENGQKWPRAGGQKGNFTKSCCLPPHWPQNNSQTKNGDDPWRTVTSTAKKLKT